MSRLWVLGASDPEMASIEKLLADVGEQYIYATSGGSRVHPGNAYRADEVESATHWVECSPAGGHPAGATVIDHHRPGDPGYGVGPEEFLEASSVGQVYSLVGEGGSGYEYYPDFGWAHLYRRGPHSPWERESVPAHVILTAAADHCLGAAYRGECIGVDPDTLMRFRAASRAEFQKRAVGDVLADIEAATSALETADLITLRHGPIVEPDVPGYATGHCPECGYDSPAEGECGICATHARDMRGAIVPELPEAATRLGMAYVAGPLVGPDGRKKITCSGAAYHVAAFMEDWAPREGLVDIYGDPARGFAGGYIAN